MILNRTVAPSALIALGDMKTHLRVDGFEDDLLIANLIAAATEALDGPYGMIGKCLVTQTWQMQMERVTGRSEVYLPAVPFQSLTSLTYYDADNASQSLTVGDFTVYSEQDRAWIVPDIGTNWPVMYDRPDALTVTWSAGFGAASAVPQNIKHAAMQMVSHLYENRGDEAVSMPYSVKDLAGISRIGWVG